MTEIPSKSEVSTVSGKEINELIQTGELAKADLPAEAVKEAEVSEELLEAAEAHANKQIADIKEENRKRKRNLIKLGAMTLLSVIIFIFTTIAWFASNVSTTAGGMSIKTANIPFEIATTGTTVRNDATFIKADSTYTYGDDTAIAGYYSTNGSNPQIKIRYTPTVNDETDFGPGSSGVIEFYVIPKRDGDLEVKIDLDVIGFRELDDNDKTIKRISDLTVANSGLEQTVIDQYKSADDFLSGHIMFFEELGDTAQTTLEGSRYYYKKPITSKSFTRSFSNARKDVPQKVTVYWMWTNTLGQIALKDNTSGLRSDYPVVQDAAGTDISGTDKAKVIQYLKDNKAIVFLNSSEISDSDIDDAKTKAKFTMLSDGYNDADFLIGSSVSYFIIDISVGLNN